jgi:hypothetical protein
MRFVMIDLRMVADDQGYTQLQVRSFCIQRGWTEWKSVPIVHDPSQFVAGVEVFDAKTSGAKPDGGLTAAQVAKILEDWLDATPEHVMRAIKGEAFKARFKQEASNPNWVCTDVDGYDLTLRGWDQGSFIDSAGEQWDLCQVYCKRS